MLAFLTSQRVPLAVAALLLFASGCGVSQYNSLYSKQITSLRASSKFEDLYAATALPDSPMSMRVPMVFRDSYQETSGHKVDGAKISPDRLQPPFLKLPGFKICYEGTNTVGPRTVPFYCYVAGQPARPGDAEKLREQLLAQLKKTFPDAPDSWSAVDADTPEGLYIHWDKVRVEGNQPFFVKNDNKVATEVLPGIFELWVHDADDYVAMIAWRVPNDAQGTTKLTSGGNQLKAMFEGPPKDAKLDLEKFPTSTAGTLTITKGAEN